VIGISTSRRRTLACAAIIASLAACAPVGPEFVRTDVEVNEQWSENFHDEFQFEAQDSVAWWQILDDPILNQLVELTRQQNNNIKIAGLRVEISIHNHRRFQRRLPRLGPVKAMPIPLPAT